MNIFKQLFLSLYSPKSIALWRNQGIGKTILFVFLLTLVSILPISIYFSIGITNGVEAAQESLKNDFPDFSISDGQLTSEATSPISIQKDEFTIILDPTGETSWNDLNGTQSTIALLKDELAISTGGTVDHFAYSTLGDFTLTKADALDFMIALDSLIPIALTIFIIGLYLFSSALKFIEVSVLALIGTLFKGQGTSELKYRHLWRLAAYSITLPTIFFTIMDVFQTGVPMGFFLQWFVSILVLVLTLKEIPKTKEII